MEKKPAAERVLEALDAAVEAKHKVEGLGIDPIKVLVAEDKGEAVEDRPEVAELIEKYAQLRKSLDELSEEGFPTQA